MAVAVKGMDAELRKFRDATHLATDGPAPRRYDGRTTAARVRAAVFVRSEKSNALVGGGFLQPAPRSGVTWWLTLGSTLSLPCLGARPRPQPRTGPATCRANWLVGGERRRRRIVVSSACNFAPRARGASRCMRGAENLVLQEGQAARRDLTRALKAGPPGEGAERSHRLFVLPGG